MKYRAYLTTGEILECDNFKTIFQSARYIVRADASAAIICDNATHKPISYLLNLHGLYAAFKAIEIDPKVKAICEKLFIQNDYECYVKAVC